MGLKYSCSCLDDHLYQRLAAKEILILPKAKLEPMPVSAVGASIKLILLGFSVKRVY